MVHCVLLINLCFVHDLYVKLKTGKFPVFVVVACGFYASPSSPLLSGPPPTTTESSSAADLPPCHHHPLPCLPAPPVVRHCSTLPPIPSHCPPPPSPNTIVCQPSSQPSSQPSLTAAAIVRHNHGPLDIPVPIVKLKFIQSLYESPPYKKIGDGAELKARTAKERPRGRAAAYSTRYTWELNNPNPSSMSLCSASFCLAILNTKDQSLGTRNRPSHLRLFDRPLPVLKRVPPLNYICDTRGPPRLTG